MQTNWLIDFNLWVQQQGKTVNLTTVGALIAMGIMQL